MPQEQQIVEIVPLRWVTSHCDERDISIVPLTVKARVGPVNVRLMTDERELQHFNVMGGVSARLPHVARFDDADLVSALASTRFMAAQDVNLPVSPYAFKDIMLMLPAGPYRMHCVVEGLSPTNTLTLALHVSERLAVSEELSLFAQIELQDYGLRDFDAMAIMVHLTDADRNAVAVMDQSLINARVGQNAPPIVSKARLPGDVAPGAYHPWIGLYTRSKKRYSLDFASFEGRKTRRKELYVCELIIE